MLRALLAFVMLSLAGIAAADAVLTIESAINKAGRQRMLSQRIVKAYCQIGMDVMAEVSRRQLDESVALFDTQLEELRNFVTAAGMRAGVERLESLWKPMRALATGPVERDAARKLAAASEEVLRAAHALTLQLQDSAATPQGRLVNMAGRQRMMSQRLAKLYMLRAWGLETPQAREDMETARYEFAAALATLQQSPQNNQMIALELEAAAIQWEWFKSALEMEGAVSYQLLVADASEGILRSLERITGLYEKLGAR